MLRAMPLTLTIDGRQVPAEAGETVLAVARRVGADVPTLCHDPRLEPAGACRSCLVEIQGQRRLQPACAFPVAQGMVVTTDSERIQRHRRVLMSLYLADHDTDADGLPRQTPVGNQLRTLAQASGPLLDLPKVHAPRADRPGDANPYIAFDPSV